MADRQFIAIDGDDVGNHLRDHIIANNIEGISLLSARLVEYFGLLRSILETNGNSIVFCAGDSLLAFTTQSILNSWFSELPTGPCTISIGIGETPEFAYLALQLAKARGKNQAVRLEGTVANTVYAWSGK